MNCLSLFDGLSAGQLALSRAGIEYSNYFASEIDKYTIKICQKNYPKTIQLGDVGSVGPNLPNIDLLLGGSPCQSFSNIGKGEGFDGKSGLFYEFIRILNRVKPTYFLFENVKMKKEWADVITKELGVAPQLINSSLVSAQNRQRLYWTNISFSPIEDRGIRLEDVLLPKDKIPLSLYLSQKAKNMMDRPNKDGRDRWVFALHSDTKRDKSACVLANWCKGVPSNVLIDRRLTTIIRHFHPIEVERLQTIPDDYTDCVSKTQRFKMIGNSWTVDIIAHILGGLPH